MLKARNRWLPIAMIFMQEDRRSPANHFGNGKAWHVASRNDLAFQRDFFCSLMKENSLCCARLRLISAGRGGDQTHGRWETCLRFPANADSAQQHSVVLPQAIWTTHQYGAEYAAGLKCMGLPSSVIARNFSSPAPAPASRRFYLLIRSLVW